MNYGKPKLIELSGIISISAKCSLGSNPIGTCNTGESLVGTCQTGTRYFEGECKSGNIAKTNCGAGTSAGGDCTNGGFAKSG